MLVGLIFVGLAVALIVGPIMMMRPTGRQQQLSRLRTEALSLGLSTSLQKLPKGLSVHKYPEQVAVYQKRWQQRRFSGSDVTLLRLEFSHELHFCDHWDWQGDTKNTLLLNDELKQLLNTIDDSVIAVTINHIGLGLHWLEKSIAINKLVELADVIEESMIDSNLLLDVPQ